jgi:hypothetical protein
MFIAWRTREHSRTVLTYGGNDEVVADTGRSSRKYAGRLTLGWAAQEDAGTGAGPPPRCRSPWPQDDERNPNQREWGFPELSLYGVLGSSPMRDASSSYACYCYLRQIGDRPLTLEVGQRSQLCGFILNSSPVHRSLVYWERNAWRQAGQDSCGLPWKFLSRNAFRNQSETPAV